MAIIQLDLWKSSEECEIEALRAEVDAVKISSDKVRRKCFAEIGRYAKLVDDLSERLKHIERHLCRNTPLNTTSQDCDLLNYMSSKEATKRKK